MALTATHLVIIGQGRLIADTDLSTFIRDNTADDVFVRSPAATALAPILVARGATVVIEATDAVAVSGLDPAEISALATAHALAIHELTRRAASLEEAYLNLTDSATRYRGTQPEAGEPETRARRNPR
jgi:ABC-2 type transport system ATP-binding protein